METKKVQVGQFWQSMDERDGNWRANWRANWRGDLEVISILPDGTKALVRNAMTGRHSSILVSRMQPGPRGYRLIGVRKSR